MVALPQLKFCKLHIKGHDFKIYKIEEDKTHKNPSQEQGVFIRIDLDFPNADFYSLNSGRA